MVRIRVVAQAALADRHARIVGVWRDIRVCCARICKAGGARHLRGAAHLPGGLKAVLLTCLRGTHSRHCINLVEASPSLSELRRG